MMEAHNFVTIDSWGKFRASTVPLNTGNDGTTAGLPQALAFQPHKSCLNCSPMKDTSKIARDSMHMH